MVAIGPVAIAGSMKPIEHTDEFPEDEIVARGCRRFRAVVADRETGDWIRPGRSKKLSTVAWGLPAVEPWRRRVRVDLEEGTAGVSDAAKETEL